MINAMERMHMKCLAAWLECSKCSINIHTFRAIFREAYLVKRQ